MTHWLDTGFLVVAEVSGHSDHASPRQKHVVTDPKRFTQPLSVTEALDRADIWWHSPEVDQLSQGGLSIITFLGWMRQNFLGRKRILDTMLASMISEVQITSVLTTKVRDFAVLGGFVSVVR